MGSWVQKGDNGAGVRRVQELLLDAGFKLPKWGIDGGYGDETVVAVKAAQQKFGLKVDGIAGKKTLNALHEFLESQDAHQGKDPKPTDAHELLYGIEGATFNVIDGVEVFDFRGCIDPPKNGRSKKPWSDISGLVLHRTACRLGENPKRYLRVNAHAHVSLKGRIILCHPWDLHIWHGHAPSSWCIGIEFDGNPTGRPGYWWKAGGGPDDLTDQQVKAGLVLLKLFMDEFKKQGSDLKYIYSHRQGSDQRECDPGDQCWDKVAVPWMEISGAVPGDIGWQGTVFGTGYHVPQSWDPRSPVTSFRKGK